MAHILAHNGPKDLLFFPGSFFMLKNSTKNGNSVITCPHDIPKSQTLFILFWSHFHAVQ